jgi:hypothetical protein
VVGITLAGGADGLSLFQRFTLGSEILGQLAVQSQPTLLDLGKPSRSALFTAVIYGDHRAKFGTPETSLRGSASV